MPRRYAWRFRRGATAACNTSRGLDDCGPCAFDHWQVGDHLDFAAWDSYPIGFAEHFPFGDPERQRWQDTPHPDIAPFHHDLYRGVGRGRFWVMEQQPGPVNWAAWNPAPAHDMVRLGTLEAHADGADVVSFFRWRQASFAQEQMHAGLNLPSSHELSPGGREAAATGGDLARLGDLPATAPAQVAIVYDYEAHCAFGSLASPAPSMYACR